MLQKVAIKGLLILLFTIQVGALNAQIVFAYPPKDTLKACTGHNSFVTLITDYRIDSVDKRTENVIFSIKSQTLSFTVGDSVVREFFLKVLPVSEHDKSAETDIRELPVTDMYVFESQDSNYYVFLARDYPFPAEYPYYSCIFEPDGTVLYERIYKRDNQDKIKYKYQYHIIDLKDFSDKTGIFFTHPFRTERLYCFRMDE